MLDWRGDIRRMLGSWMTRMKVLGELDDYLKRKSGWTIFINYEIEDYIESNFIPKKEACHKAFNQDKWCQGCLVKIKPSNKYCSYCGKSTDSFYTSKNFKDGELLI